MVLKYWNPLKILSLVSEGFILHPIIFLLSDNQIPAFLREQTQIVLFLIVA